MRLISTFIFFVFLASSRLVHAQSFELYGSAGPTITDPGSSIAAGGGFSPTSRVSLLFGVERTHLSSQTVADGRFVSQFRGGTLLLGSAELRVTPLGRTRVGPYGLVGLAVGESRPNVNQFFPDAVTNQVRALFAGGGVQVPIGERLTVFGDARWMYGGEGNDGIIAVAPLRAGLAWHF